MHGLRTQMDVHIAMRKGEDALRAANEAFGIYEASGEDGEAPALLMVAEARMVAGDYEASKEAARQAIDLCNVAGDFHGKAGAICKLAKAQFLAEDPEDGFSSLQEALETYRTAGSQHGEATIINEIAAENSKVGSFEDALFIAAEGEDICRNNGLKALLAAILTTRATACMGRINSGQSTDTHLNWQARVAAKEALSICRELGDKKGAVKALYVLSQAFFEYGNYMEARAKAKLAVEICYDIGDKANEGMNLIMVAQTRLVDNKEEAVRLAKMADKLIKDSGDTELAKDSAEALDFIRDWDPKKKEKEEAAKARSSEAQSAKTDYTLDFDYMKTRAVYFDAFIARALRARA